jgi:hypothetical protein
MEYQVFTTGDQIWTSIRYGKRATVKLITHDGLAWEEGEETFHRLTGVEKLAHRVQVFFIRLILKAQAA